MPLPTPSVPWATYLRWMLGTALAVVAGVGAFNIVVDPLGIFSSPRVAGFNAIKPLLSHHQEASRWAAARRACADTGIFGNSRAEIGLDPANPTLAKMGLSAFNNALPGTTIATSHHQLAWLQSVGCMPRTLILGVEFLDFLGDSAAQAGTAESTRPAPSIDSRLLAEAVFSTSGLFDSAKTIAIQHTRYPATITERGFNPLLEYIPEAALVGQYVMFRQRAQENLRIWSRKPKRLRPSAVQPSTDEVLLDAILTRAGRAGSTTYLVIYPYHAQVRMMFERLELGELFAQWKRMVVAQAARHTAAGHKVEVWDFSGISPETQEAIPSRDDRKTQLEYYWEGGHFKKALGDRMLANLFGQEQNFGRRITENTLEAWLADDRQQARALLASPSPLRDEVDDLMK